MNNQKQLLNILFGLIFLLMGISAFGQGWERIYFTEPNPDLSYTYSSINHAFIEPDGSYLFAAIVEGNSRWLYTDENGIITNLTPAVHAGANLIRSADQNFVYAARTNGGSPPLEDVILSKFDLAGNVLWTHRPEGYFFGNEAVSDFIQTANGDYVIAGGRAQFQPQTAYPYITRVDESGNVVWKTVGSALPETNIYEYSVVQTTDGGFFMAASSTWFTPNNPLLTSAIRLDANGEIIWNGMLSADIQIEQMVNTADGNIVLLGRNTDYDYNLLKIDDSGNTIWEVTLPQVDYPFSYSGDLILTADNGYAFLGNSQGGSEDVHLVKTDEDGQVQWTQVFGGPFGDNGNSLVQTAEGGFVIGGGANGMDENQSAYIVRTDEEGNASTGLIQGQVLYDTNEDCQLAPDEQALENWIVAAAGSSGLFYGSVAEDGTYQIEVNPGEYTVTLSVPNAYWLPCTNDIMATAMDTVTVDFPVQSVEQCPLMEVQVQNYGLRLCEPAIMNVLARNIGTELAEDVSVDIFFDDDLEILGASVPFSPVGVNTYNFEVGDVDFLDELAFTVEVVTSCDIVLLGQSLCVEAQIYPDSSCLIVDEMWSGASIEVSANCEDDEVLLMIENIGESAMEGQLRYTVIEDHVIMLEGIPFGPLNPGQSIEIPRTADGTFYRIESEQAPFHPGMSMPSAFMEACGTNGSGEVSLGYVNQFPMDDADYHTDINCIEVVAAYDPNTKKALPKGYAEEHYIEQNTRIDYQLNFQNTGTATANQVVLMDQLRPHLDPATVRPGVSSHPYQFEMLRDGIIRFSFPDIQLPDSTANEPGSHGFVQFSIEQKADVPLGTVIENTAAIYFDFNPAVWTNTTYHTIGRDYILVDVDEQIHPGFAVKVFPNPFMDIANFTITDAATKSLTFTLHDSSGRRIIAEEFLEGHYQLDGRALPAGIYFYQIQDHEKLISSGKVIAR